VQKATLVAELPPNPKHWSFELKWDGYRILALKSEKDVRLISRRGQDWTEDFRPIAAAVAKLGSTACVIDGELCALDANGVPSFQLLQQRQRGQAQFVFAVFDLLWIDGEDLRDQPLEVRRARLTAVVGAAKGSPIVLSEPLEGDPAELLARARKHGIEGLIAKQKGSKYSGARAGTWLKIKCKRRQEFAIGGYLPLLGHTDAVGGLVLALHDDEGFLFAGKVGTGFGEKERYELAKLLDEDRVDQPVVRNVPRAGGPVRHCKPRHVCEVEFTEWTEGGHVRHPSFQGLRKDKKPEDCVRELEAPAE
jgi:bifunctional non-homologous end joining protein LigD